MQPPRGSFQSPGQYKYNFFQNHIFLAICSAELGSCWMQCYAAHTGTDWQSHRILPVLICQLHNEKVFYSQLFSLGETLHCITSEWWYFTKLVRLLHYAKNLYKVWNRVILYLWLAKLFHIESTLKLELYFTLDNKTCLIYIRFIVHYHLMNINLRPGFVLSSFLYSFFYFFC